MSSLTSQHRRIILIILAMLVWLAWCLPSLLANLPDAFQASGSVIVVMAVVIYARERSKRESEVTQAQRRQIVAMLNEHDHWGSFHESRVSRSALKNEIQLLELRRLMSSGESAIKSVDDRIASVQQELIDTSDKHARLHENMQQSHANWVKINSDAEDIVLRQAPTAKAMEKLEIFLVALGTLQWGYGDRWVEMFHNTF